jgi:hypothetical protein
MGKPYNQQYLDVSGSSHGSMQCGHCGKQITEGEYRCAQKSANHDWHYVTHHRACCEADPGWAKKDKARQAVESLTERITHDVKALLAKYAGNKDWVLEEMHEQLGYEA